MIQYSHYLIFIQRKQKHFFYFILIIILFKASKQLQTQLKGDRKKGGGRKIKDTSFIHNEYRALLAFSHQHVMGGVALHVLRSALCYCAEDQTAFRVMMSNQTCIGIAEFRV